MRSICGCVERRHVFSVVKNWLSIIVQILSWSKMEDKCCVCLCFLGLQASLLVRHPDTGELYVNCDPQLIQLIRETECMMKMKLPIPETARLLYLRRTTFKSVVDDLKVGVT